MAERREENWVSDKGWRIVGNDLRRHDCRRTPGLAGRGGLGPRGHTQLHATRTDDRPDMGYTGVGRQRLNFSWQHLKQVFSCGLTMFIAVKAGVATGYVVRTACSG